MAGLVDLLQDLDSDAALRDQYKDDREAVFQQYNLSEEETQALRDLDVDKVKQLSGIDNLHVTHVIIKPSN